MADRPDSTDRTDRPYGLRTDAETDPAAVHPDEVRFSWRADPGVGRRQTAYRVVVGRTADAVARREGDVWDSGKVAGTACTDVPYEGPPLAADERYHWTVRVWNGEDSPTPFSDPATFATAPAGGAGLGGEWIGHQPGAGDSNGFMSRWHRPDEDGTAWVQVDLGSVREIDAVELHPAAPFDRLETPDGFEVTPLYSRGEADGYLETVEAVEGFGFPEGYRIEVGDDSGLEDATTVVDRTADAVDNPGGEPVVHPLDGDDHDDHDDGGVRARYVRVTATDPYAFDPSVADQLAGGAEENVAGTAQVQPDRVREEYGAWTAFALAALAVRSGGEQGEDLAVGADVTAASSRETATWGRDRLVDGVDDPGPAAESPLLRTTFELSKPVASARLHVAALGYGEPYLDGEKVGDAVLDPGWTVYDERVPFRTYEVGDRLEAGEHALGLWLGRGFFGRSELNWTGFGSPRARLRLTVEYEDGTTRTVVSGPDWRATDSPIVENDVYDGEVYDARREQPRWAAPGIDDAGWADAAPMPAPGGELVPQRVEPTRVVREFEPEAIEEREDGTLIGFGQNLTGWLELRIDGADAGDEIRLRHAEIRDEGGDLSTVDLRSADATDTYVARGDDAERYEPRFTYHGFQYAHVAGYPGELTAADVTAKAVHTDLEPIGEFECASEQLERVQHSAEWSLRGNAVAIPTGCAQRGERTGWTGDAHLSARALLFNFDARRFHRKWQRDHDADQSPHGYLPDTIPHATGRIPADPSWAVTRVLLPWYLYQHYGDADVLGRHYDTMRRYVDFWHEEAESGIVPGEYGYYGDWLAFEHTDEGDDRIGQPLALFNTASHYRTADLLARIAGILGNDADAERYRSMAAETAAAFNERFFDADAGQYDPATQAAQAVPLHYGMVPAGREGAVADALAELVAGADERLMTGFLGTPALVHALAEHGHEELAYRVVSQPEQPGWVYMVENGVTTTLWERWDSDDQVGSGMNSFNHHQFAYVSEWFFERLAGLRLDGTGPGVERVEIAPAVVDDLEWAAGRLETPHGELASRWEGDDAALDLAVTVPWNTTATVRVPARPSDATVTIGGEPVWRDGAAVPERARPEGVGAVRAGDGAVEVVVAAGDYGLEREQ